MLLHKTVVCLTTFLLCLSPSSTAPESLRPNAEVQASLKDETSPTQQSEAAGAAAALHPARVWPMAGDALRQDKGRPKSSTWRKKEKKEPFEATTALQSNTTQEATDRSGGSVSRGSVEGKQRKTTQKVSDNLDTRGWFTETLNVTVTPRVVWTRLPAPKGTPLHTEEEESAEKEGERNEDEEDDILLTVTFMKEGQQLVLDLHPNRDLLAAEYTESSGGEAGGDDTLPREDKALPCEYQGVVRGVAKAWAALSVCDGLRGVVSGALEEGQQVELFVEPSPGSTSVREPHKVFSSSLLSLPGGACGVKDDGSETEAEDSFLTAEARSNASLSSRRMRRWAGLKGGHLWYQSNARFVELVLVADFSFFSKYGDQTRSRCKTLVNIVNAVYRPLGVVVVLSHLEVWEHGDKIQVTEDYKRNLNYFKDYRKKMLKEETDYNNDNTMLLTTVDFRGSTVGYAVISGMCSITGSSGVVQDKQDHVGVAAYTVAHEMGHNFGMKHDEDQGNACDCDSCIMSDVGSYKFDSRKEWSSCSKRLIEEKLDSVSYQCLRNVPTRMYPRTSCGDGVVDVGEQCDCGPAEFCDNPCCVAKTCRFAVNASCASGPCCDTKTCQPKPLGDVCRAASTECDLPEFCSGSSEACPDDVVKGNGAPCHGGQGHCYEAKCGSHEDQCRGMWGERARVADHACFSHLNKRGGSNGNCGFKEQSKTKLLPCADGDELCGSLQCLPVPGTQPASLGAAFNFGTYTFRGYSCSYIVSSDTIPLSYWVSPDGANCGKNKMCINQKCVHIPEPTGHCRSGCSGHGVCNSRNHCHCDSGYAPPDCSKKGSGGSIDSYTIGRDRYKDPLWEAIFILSLILLGIAIVVCCLWSHIRRWWEAGGRSKICPCCASCLDACCCIPMSLITERLCTKKKKEKDVSREAHDEYERDRMICQVDLDLKDKQSKSNSWGVANERLVTEVISTKPKDSPDYSRKILLPPNYSAHHSKTSEIPNRPTYMQSVSVDSGCVSDADDTTVKEPFGSQMSLKSLLRVFKNTGFQNSSSPAEEENVPPKTYERQRSMPLSRFVVDPLAGNRRSRQGTPPPEHMKPEWRRSVSMDTNTNSSGIPKGTLPPPPPPIGKPSKGITITTQTCTSSKQCVSKPRDTHSDDNGRYTSILGSKKSLRLAPVNSPPAAPTATPPLPSKAKKPMMPPNKKNLASTESKTPSSNGSSLSSNSSSKPTQERANGPPKRPILSPGKGPSKPSGAKPYGSSNQRAVGEVPRPSMAGGRVRDLAKKLEKQ